MAEDRASADTRNTGQGVNADEGGGAGPYPVFCCYCGVLTRTSTVEHTSGMCRPCLDRVWGDHVRRHPADALKSAETTGRE